MALIGKIRQRTGLLLGFIGVSMLIFLVQEAISSNSMMGGSAKSIGKINGKNVDTQKFFEEVNRYEQRIKTLNPNLSMNEENTNYIREEVWNNLAVESIFGKSMDQLGLTVTSTELAEYFKGEELHPLVMNVLGQYFINPETGQFDKGQYLQAVNNMDQTDPMFRQLVIQLEPLVEQERMREKYTSIVAKSAYFPTFIAQEKLSQPQTASADVLSVPYSSVAEDIEVSDDEIIAYIKNHPAKYEREKNVVLDVVTFDIHPSEEDEREIAEQLLKIKEDLAVTDDDSLYIARTSIQGGIIIYEGAEQIRQSGRSKADSIISSPVGTFIGPYTDNDNIVLSYIAGRKMVPDSISASRIILAYQSVDDIATKKALSEEIVADIKSGKASFADKAREFSDDPSTKNIGGDMGYFSQGMVEAELNQKLFYEMSVGQIETIESENGVYIIQKTGQSTPKLATRVVDFASDLIASDETAKKIFNKANQFWQESRTVEEFDENMKTQKALKNLTIYTKDIKVGDLPDTRSIVAWAFKDAKAGEVNFFDLADMYAVVKVVAKNEKGLASLNEVKAEVQAILLAEKQAEAIKDKLAKNNSGSLEEIAQKVNGKVETDVNVLYSNSYIDRIGYEPKLVGAIFGTAVGQKSSPISGDNGVYIVQATSIADASKPTDDNLKMYKLQLFKQNASQLSFENIFESALKNTKVDDRRYSIY